MPLKTHDSLVQSEEAHKERIYQNLEAIRSEAHQAENRRRNYVNSGAYEDQAAFMAYADLSSAREKFNAADQLYRILYRKPYFAHIEILENGESKVKHCFLSDCELLDQPVFVEDRQVKGVLLPFKQDKERPISSALFHCYQAKDGKKVKYIVKTQYGRNEVSIQPVFICDDEILNRELLGVSQLFPETEFLHVDADELLESKLNENRNNPTLRNIIATLQRKQFQIIETDLKKSFVVQGCAGSGKSQCLLHRLFYLRDELSQDGWEHVLLLTPTQLFRNYSSELVRRYQLSDIHNCSLAELYKSLLSAYDPRFKNRQYKFELSEEYLPDQYLQVVYADSTIQSIDEEIVSAINRYVASACVALDMEMIGEINSNSIAELIRLLDAEIEAYDSREAILAQDSEYEERRKRYNQLQKMLVSAQKNLEKLQKEQSENDANLEKLNTLFAAVQEARDEIGLVAQQRSEKITTAKKKLFEYEKAFSGYFPPDIPAKYAHQLYVVNNMTSGQEYAADEEYLAFLREVVTDAEIDLSEFVKGQKPEKVLLRFQKKQSDLSERIRSLNDEIEENISKLEEYANWLKEKASELEGEKSRIILQRSEMDRARYFLSRIESTVFEQVIWNALLPYKEQNHVKALDIAALDDSHQKETRILYKSDLLFYVKVYARIHSTENLPVYNLLCIDEGQDLHKADYDMLHMLFPNAVFNIFGDTDQVLHTACGISDWKVETNVPNIYSLNRNYRNTAAIVDFCNKKFGSSMDAVGSVQAEQYPSVLKDAMDLRKVVMNKNVVVIVRDRQCYEMFCSDIGVSFDMFEFLDTRTDKAAGQKSACFSIFAAKGLEFSNVAVYAKNMTTNQKVVACTRAMEGLYYYE
ncbi:MAG: AAA family ATPase [Clostridiales bacterium]|nr:AAA family ATPase [Clostridiales bacterium]